MINIPKTDYDGAWKEILEDHFELFLLFCFPVVHAQIDWSKPIEFLNQELVDLIRDAALGKQQVDKLVKVLLKGGQQAEILAHVEIQSQKDIALPERLYQYHFRIRTKHSLPVVTLAVLADDHAQWHPRFYEEETMGCRLRFDFLTCKLRDFDEVSLLSNNNPMALIVAAHLGALRTAKDPDSRARYKMRLIRRLFAVGFGKDDITHLFRFIDWLMVLPEEKELEIRQEVMHLEGEVNMPYITTIERMATQKGLEEGREKGRVEGRVEGRQQGLHEGFLQARRLAIIESLEERFGSVPDALRDRVQALPEEVLGRSLRSAVSCPSLERFLQSL